MTDIASLSPLLTLVIIPAVLWYFKSQAIKADELIADQAKLAGMKIDTLTEKHEQDLEKIHQIELRMEGLVKREELTAISREFYRHIEDFKTEMLKALASRSNN